MFCMKAAKNEFHEFTSEGQTFFFYFFTFEDLRYRCFTKLTCYSPWDYKESDKCWRQNNP